MHFLIYHINNMLENPKFALYSGQVAQLRDLTTKNNWKRTRESCFSWWWVLWRLKNML